jgi:uncharacterized membrane protein YjfL (UPF0719 family)
MVEQLEDYMDSKMGFEFLKAVLWSLVAAVSMGVSMGIVIKIYDMLTPGLDEMEELRKGNMAVGIVLAAVILATGFVIGMTMHVSPAATP